MLARAGCPTPATIYEVPLYDAVLTHFRREEDARLESGKLDEELARMASVVRQVRAGSLVLCNKSFSATNEREGSQIAEDVLRGLADAGVTVVMVTHLHELAERLRRAPVPVRFLRAERHEDGRRTFVISPGEPQPTSHARDLYERIFAPAAGA